jgi:putative ABC transport system permease protein
MSWIALRMLTGDAVKYIGMIFGVAFSTLLIAQQSSIFVGLVSRASTIIYDVRDADIWVMDPRIKSVDGNWALPSTDLYRIKGVAGVEWAAPLLKAGATINTDDGTLETATLLGVEDASLVGLPQKIVAGSRDALRAPGAILMDKAGYAYLFKNQPFQAGRTLELNDSRAVIVGLVDSGAQFSSQIAIYTRYSTAQDFAPGGRNRMSFVLAKAGAGQTPEAVAARISAATGLKALSSKDFSSATSDFIIGNTGIPISFGVVVGLGVLVGIVIVALTFTLFIRDNIKQFGALKAIGVTNWRLIGMVMLQGGLVGVVGYAFGIGLAAMIIQGGAENAPALRGFFMPWQVAAMAAGVVALIIVIAGFGALRRVLTTDPASVFRG